MKRRTLLAGLTAAALACGSAGNASPAKQPADYPSKPIRLIVGYTAGGASDLIGRELAQAFSSLNGQAVVVENRPGVGGMLGLSEVVRSAPDGYTLGIAVSGTMVTGPHLQKNTPYDPLTDFSPVGMVAKAPMVLLATPGFEADTVGKIVQRARAEPNTLMYAAGAQAFDLAMRLFNAKADVQIGAVPYPGGGQAAIDVIGGRVPLMVDTIGAQQASIKSGKLHAVAVLDSTRSAVLPDVPTVAESGVPGYEAVGWLGLVAPKGTPPAIIEQLNTQLQRILGEPALAKKLTAMGFEPDTGTPQEFAEEIRKQHAVWGDVARQAGLTPQ